MKAVKNRPNPKWMAVPTDPLAAGLATKQLQKASELALCRLQLTAIRSYLKNQNPAVFQSLPEGSPDGLLPWRGENPVGLDRQNRYLVVVHAVWDPYDAPAGVAGVDTGSGDPDADLGWTGFRVRHLADHQGINCHSLRPQCTFGRCRGSAPALRRRNT